jgi:hypothetical protein
MKLFKTILAPVLAASVMLAIAWTAARADDSQPPPAPQVSGIVKYNNHAAAGVKIKLILVDDGHNRRKKVASTVTDADGRFTFSDLTPGDYAVWAIEQHERVHVDATHSPMITLVLNRPPPAAQPPTTQPKRLPP